MENDRDKRSSRQAICTLCFLSMLVPSIFVFAWRPILLPYSVKYAKMVFSNVINDRQRFMDNELQCARNEWRLYQMEARYGQTWCTENVAARSDLTWLTIVTNDDFAVPALVLGHSIRTFSCQKNMMAFISKDVSEDMRQALWSVGWDTRMVKEMDCEWMDINVGGDRNSGFFGRPLGHRIKGTHTRFHAWNYTEFSKIIYVDADYMLMTNIDELFDIPEDFAAAPCARPGVLDPCFNAGLLVFRPAARHYLQIMKMWWETTERDTCPSDQELLNDYYTEEGDWKALPYAYNIRRTMFRPLKSFHFGGSFKPWFSECRPSRREANNFDRPILVIDDVVILFWKNFYQLIITYTLEEWWRSTTFFRPEQEFGNVSYATCVKHRWESESNPFNLTEMINQLNGTQLNLIERFNSIFFGRQSDSQSINQSINQSVSQSVSQSINPLSIT